VPYCRRCGAEVGEGGQFCAACGAPVTEPARSLERRSDGMKLVLYVFGGIVILVAFALFMGGGALLWVQTGLTDEDGFITTNGQQLQRSSYALVV